MDLKYGDKVIICNYGFYHGQVGVVVEYKTSSSSQMNIFLYAVKLCHGNIIDFDVNHIKKLEE